MDQYRVYGNPIKQSKSPAIHQAFATQTKQDIHYDRELVALDQFELTVRSFIESGGKGANVTAPFKEEAMRLCDELTDRAELAGAVNTLSFNDGKIYGDTTDGDGLVNDLLANKVELKHKRVLLLGAGGAAKGVVSSILQQLPAALVIANRTIAKAQAIKEQYTNQPITACSFEQTKEYSFDVIINATSAGLNDQKLPIPEQIITASTYCYDMTYGKELTPFLKVAKQRGAKKIIDGLGMLVGQAAVSFTIWRNVQPDPKAILTQLRDEMGR